MSVKTAQLWSRWIAIQQGCKNSMAGRQPWDQGHLWLDSSALPCAGFHSVPVRHLQDFRSSCWGNSLQWKGKVLSEPLGDLTYTDRSHYRWSLIGLSSNKWGLQILSVWMVQMHCSNWSEWSHSLVGEDTSGDVAAQIRLDGESLSPIGWNKTPGTPL